MSTDARPNVRVEYADDDDDNNARARRPMRSRTNSDVGELEAARHEIALLRRLEHSADGDDGHRHRCRAERPPARAMQRP